MLKEWW